MKVLERRLGMWSVVIISISAMLGSGVFVLPGLAVGMTGGSAWLAYATVALCILPAALSKAELASALPQSGGAYVFINQAFGPLTGTIMGLGLWGSLLLKSSFALVGFGEYLRVLGPTIPLKPIAIALLLLISLLNMVGIKKVSQVQTYVVALALTGLLLLILASLPQIRVENFAPFFRKGFFGFSETVAFVFVSYAGVTKVAAIAGEVRDPGKNLPRAIVIALCLVTPLYCLVVFALNGNIVISQLQTDIRPIYSLAQTVIGPVGGTIAAIIAVLTMTSMANAGLLAASRFPFAMSRDGLIPPLFSQVHPRYLTPTFCIIATAAVMGSAILLLDIERIVKLASACMILGFGANNIALIILRTSKAQWYKPEYQSPLYPALPTLGTLISIVLLVAMGKMALLAIGTITIPGTILYLFYGRKRNTERGALGKMVPRTDVHRNKLSTRNDGLEEILSHEASSIVAVIGQELSVETLTHTGSAL
ncbi:MAG: amino acid permease, partial [Myxococcota bacterium]|nr:amino acid permease [Myxococcota bacterium]